MLEEQRQLYNAALQERIEAWRKASASITRLDQQKSLTQIRADNPAGYGASSLQIGRWTLKRLDDAFKAFFKRAKKGQTPGFPRFKSKQRWRSFGFLEWSGCRLVEGQIQLKGIDRGLRVSWHRQLPKNAVIKGASFTKVGRRWFISLQIESSSIVAKRHDAPESRAGIDVGVESLATWDDGKTFDHIFNAKPRTRRERELRIAQRALARCRKGSSRRRKVKARIARIHERTANHRTTHLHQQSEALARRFSTIFVEKLKIRNMTRSAAGTVADPGKNVRQKSGLNREILDAGWGRFIEFLRYKAERAGGTVINVDPKWTSQLCSNCSTLVRKPLKKREHACPACDLEVHRDVNAARNIRARGLAASAASRGVIAPGEPNVAGCGERAPGTLLAA